MKFVLKLYNVQAQIKYLDWWVCAGFKPWPRIKWVVLSSLETCFVWVTLSLRFESVDSTGVVSTLWGCECEFKWMCVDNLYTLCQPWHFNFGWFRSFTSFSECSVRYVMQVWNVHVYMWCVFACIHVFVNAVDFYFYFLSASVWFHPIVIEQ